MDLDSEPFWIPSPQLRLLPESPPDYSNGFIIKFLSGERKIADHFVRVQWELNVSFIFYKVTMTMLTIVLFASKSGWNQPKYRFLSNFSHDETFWVCVCAAGLHTALICHLLTMISCVSILLSVICTQTRSPSDLLLSHTQTLLKR